MKKYFVIALGGILLFGATGCGKKNQVTCTRTSSESGETMTEEGVFEFDKDDKLTGGTATYSFNSSDTAKSYCEFFKSMVDSNNIDLITCSDKTITVKNLEKIESSDDDSSSLVGMDKDEFIKMEEESGYNCK